MYLSQDAAPRGRTFDRKSSVAPGLSFRPAASAFSKLLRRPRAELISAAIESWQIAPGTEVTVRPVICLPGQLDRIRGSEFGSVEEVLRDFKGGFASMQGATMGYRLKNVLLSDGTLYAEGAVRPLRRRARWTPAARPAREFETASIYESWMGNRWFGLWLANDCPTYRLAEETGHPFTIGQRTGHKADYEDRLGMVPERGSSAWFRELHVFDDASNNRHKRRRADAIRDRLARDAMPDHPGVFLLRGNTGDPRVLRNERQIAERLERTRDFQIIDPSYASVDEIAHLCANARVVAGVEGSHLNHGFAVMPPKSCALAIFPPTRAVSVMKMLTDRQEQDFAVVIGEGYDEAFTADINDIERTLDLVK